MEITNKNLSRRKFFAIGTAAAGSFALLGITRPDTAIGAEEKDVSRYAILYDTTKCVGCHICEKACNREHGLTGPVTFDIGKLTGKLELSPNEAAPTTRSAQSWLRVAKGAVSLGGWWSDDVYTRHSCFHCGLCAQVCPSGALTQRKDGIVVMNTERCFGCKYCYQACPFDIPRYKTGKDGGDKAMQKCDMCASRIDAGNIPACVEICPRNALEFGVVETVVKDGKARSTFLSSKGTHDITLYGENELGGLGLLQILRYDRENYELPDLG